MPSPLPEDVRAALSNGDKITAIRLLRKQTGLGLAEAKAAVDAGFVPSRSARTPTGQLPPQVSAALVAGNKIEAIKLLREVTGMGLKESRDMIDAAIQGGSIPGARLESGEVPRRWYSSGPAFILAVLAAVALGWALFGDS